MSLKTKITIAVISAVLLIAAIVVVCILTLSKPEENKVEFSASGDVAFVSNDIDCTISEGNLNYGEKKNKAGQTGSSVMQGMTYSTDSSIDNAAKLNSWKGLDLAFDKDGTAIKISWTITNNAEATSYDYITASVAINKGTSNNMKDIVSVCPTSIAPGTTENYSLTFEVDNKTKSASLNNFSITFTLNHFDKTPPVPDSSEYSHLSFDIVPGRTNEVAVGINNIDSDFDDFCLDENNDGTVVIPSKISIDGKVYSVTSIASNAFEINANLKQISIPDSVISIEESAFQGCNGLTSVEIPNSVIIIGKSAFKNCHELDSIVIGSGVRSIGNGAFLNCSSLNSMNFLGTLEEWCNIDFDSSSSNPLQYVRKLFIQGDEVTTAEEVNNALASINQVNKYTFNNCEHIVGQLIIPDSILSIDNYAFSGCKGLTSVTIGDNVESLGDYVFYNCGGLTSAIIGSRVKNIGKSAFYNCTNLSSVEFKNINGWEVATYTSFNNSTNIDSQMTAGASQANATLLKATYYNKYWRRVEA